MNTDSQPRTHPLMAEYMNRGLLIVVKELLREPSQAMPLPPVLEPSISRETTSAPMVVRRVSIVPKAAELNEASQNPVGWATQSGVMLASATPVSPGSV